jgi:hypothetical protein
MPYRNLVKKVEILNSLPLRHLKFQLLEIRSYGKPISFFQQLLLFRFYPNWLLRDKLNQPQIQNIGLFTTRAAALGIDVEILFERYEQKD